MSRNGKECSICTAPGGAAVVNELLAKGVHLKIIAAQTGFSKSSVHRHSKTCLTRNKVDKLIFSAKSSGKFFVRMPENDDSLIVDGERLYVVDPQQRGKLLNPENEIVKPNDAVFVVKYAPMVPEPKPLTKSTQVTEDSKPN